MALAKVMDGKIVVDEIQVEIVKREGKDQFLIKSYKKEKNQYRPFYPKLAIYKRTKKPHYELLIDHATLNQLDYKQAFMDGGLTSEVSDLDRQAEDILVAHKETKKRMSADTQNFAVIISWIAIIIIAVIFMISVYLFYQTPHVIKILCMNCGYGTPQAANNIISGGVP